VRGKRVIGRPTPRYGAGDTGYFSRGTIRPPDASALAGRYLGLFFIDAEKTMLDAQTTRIVRELTPESAALLDQIIEVTDCCNPWEGLLTVIPEMLRPAFGKH
jgi:hypothetical protein